MINNMQNNNYSNNKILLRNLHNKYNIESSKLKTLEDVLNKENKDIITQLLESKLLPINKINQISNELYGIDTIDFNSINQDELPLKYTKLKLLEKYNAVPIYVKNNFLYIAVNNPNDSLSLSSYQFNFGINTQAVLLDSYDIKKLKIVIKNKLTKLDLNSINNNSKNINNNNVSKTNDTNNYDDNTLVEYVDKIIKEAITKKASDIHFEPYKNNYRIRFRLDGKLIEIASLPNKNTNQLNSRLKIMSNLDISEKRIPQDGRFNLEIDKKTYDFRISSCPTMFGEKIVVRILDPSKAQLGVDQLGFEEYQKKLFLKTLEKLQGIILVTGPTGSGKTITLYTALNILNTIDRNISTAEDPIEINLAGINQVQVNAKTGLTFASALRCFLRQDPDIMMVGEIRDLETAEIAIKAAQTGHLVLATLHTNSASDTLTRLINMGIPSYNMATSISMIIAQRLIRKLCEHCKIIEKLPEQILINENFPIDIISDHLTIYKANNNGCDHCTSGYRGRIGLFETMIISKEMQEIILHGGSAIDIKKQAIKEKILSLRQAGLKKVIDGETSLLEVNRVTKNA